MTKTIYPQYLAGSVQTIYGRDFGGFFQKPTVLLGPWLNFSRPRSVLYTAAHFCLLLQFVWAENGAISLNTYNNYVHYKVLSKMDCRYVMLLTQGHTQTVSGLLCKNWELELARWLYWWVLAQFQQWVVFLLNSFTHYCFYFLSEETGAQSSMNPFTIQFCLDGCRWYNHTEAKQMRRGKLEITDYLRGP